MGGYIALAVVIALVVGGLLLYDYVRKKWFGDGEPSTGENISDTVNNVSEVVKWASNPIKEAINLSHDKKRADRTLELIQGFAKQTDAWDPAGYSERMACKGLSTKVRHHVLVIDKDRELIWFNGFGRVVPLGAEKAIEELLQFEQWRYDDDGDASRLNLEITDIRPAGTRLKYAILALKGAIPEATAADWYLVADTFAAMPSIMPVAGRYVGTGSTEKNFAGWAQDDAQVERLRKEGGDSYTIMGYPASTAESIKELVKRLIAAKLTDRQKRILNKIKTLGGRGLTDPPPVVVDGKLAFEPFNQADHPNTTRFYTKDAKSPFYGMTILIGIAGEEGGWESRRDKAKRVADWASGNITGDDRIENPPFTQDAAVLSFEGHALPGGYDFDRGNNHKAAAAAGYKT